MPRLILTLALTGVVAFLVRPCAADDLYGVNDSELDSVTETQYESLSPMFEQPCLEEPGNHFEFCEHCPDWTVSIDAIFVKRSRPDSRSLALNYTFTAELLNASEFDFDYEWGTRLNVQRSINDTFDLDAGYFEINDWSANARLPTATTVNVFAPLGPGISLPFVLLDDVIFSYKSDLQSAELNVKNHTSDFVTLLSGFRYVGMNEEYRFSFANGQQLNSLTTENDLFGLQLGAIMTPWDNGRFKMDFVVKGGAYYNDAKSTATSFGSTTGDGREALAFFGELGLNFLYRFNDMFAFRAGYQVMLIDGVALASDQAFTHHTLLNTGVVDTNGNVFYHGGNIGLEFMW